MIDKLSLNFELEALHSYFNKVKAFENEGQISLKYRKGSDPYIDGLGSALDTKNSDQLLFTENEFTELVDHVNNPIYEVIESVRELAKSQYQLGVGRIRFMTQMPKTCLSYHRDVEKFRFHIPLVTNSNCFFIVDDQFYRMPEAGYLYRLRVDKLHTSVNANKDFFRTHLVFATYDL